MRDPGLILVSDIARDVVIEGVDFLEALGQLRCPAQYLVPLFQFQHRELMLVRHQVGIDVQRRRVVAQLAQDDRAWTIVSPPRKSKVLLVTPGNDALTFAADRVRPLLFIEEPHRAVIPELNTDLLTHEPLQFSATATH